MIVAAGDPSGLHGFKVSANYLHLFALKKAQISTPPEEPPYVPCYGIGSRGPYLMPMTKEATIMNAATA